MNKQQVGNHSQDEEIDEFDWNEGEPPHVGWWNASLFQDPHSWAWWDGKQWSVEAHDSYSAAQASACAERKSTLPEGSIEWRTYYPENARVSRDGTANGNIEQQPAGEMPPGHPMTSLDHLQLFLQAA